MQHEEKSSNTNQYQLTLSEIHVIHARIELRVIGSCVLVKRCFISFCRFIKLFNFNDAAKSNCTDSGKPKSNF